MDRPGGTPETSLAAATALTTGLYGSLFAQVGSSRLAEDERSKRIVEEYGDRLPQDLTSCAVQRHRTPEAGRPARQLSFQRLC